MGESSLRRNWRALRRGLIGVALVPAIVLGGVVQAVAMTAQNALAKTGLVGRGGRWQDFIPHTLLYLTNNTIGLKTEWTGYPIESKRRAAIVFNHSSHQDGLALGRKFKNARFMMGLVSPNGSLLEKVFTAYGLLGTKQTQEQKPYDRGRMIVAMDAEGKNIPYFPEGIRTTGDRVLQFSSGLMPIFFGAVGLDTKGNEIRLTGDDYVLQPVALLVKAIDGKVVDRSDYKQLAPYTMLFAKGFKGVWARLQVKETCLEAHAFEPMSAREFASAQGYDDVTDIPDDMREQLARDFMNAAQAKVQAVVAPQQKRPQTRKEFKAWFADGRHKGVPPEDLSV